jgi:hypothetical protein
MLSIFGRNRADNRPHCCGGPALLTDNFAQVVFGDFKFDDKRVGAADCRDGYGLRLIHQRSGNAINHRFHRVAAIVCLHHS